MKKKCLIIDDSAIYRSQIKKAINDDPNLYVIDTAEDGLMGIEKIKQHKPDIVVLDMEMPKCDGIQTLQTLKDLKSSTPVIVFSSPTQKSAELTLKALQLGAKDFIAKPSYDRSPTENLSPSDLIKKSLVPKVHGILDIGQINKTQPTQSIEEFKKIKWNTFMPKVLAIGSSTGGPTALETLFKMLKPPFSVPILITQHMPPVFTATFAERLGKLNGINCYEASDGMLLQPNHVYVAKGGLHMKLSGTSKKAKTQLFDGEDINFIKPAVDPLFESAAKIFGNTCLGVVLTGMGHDGCEGAVEIKRQGGGMLIQNKESCAVWGMPAAVYNKGCYDDCLDLAGLAEKINEKISLNNYSTKKGVA